MPRLAGLADVGDAPVGYGGDVRFVVAEEARWQEGEGGILVMVPLAAVEELAGLFTGKVGGGGLAILPGLRFVVVS